MAARALLRKLDGEGLIRLPAPRCSANNAFRHRADTSLCIDESPIDTALAALTPLQLSPAHGQARQRLFAAMSLIREFERLAEVPVVLNTSFNINGMPMVETPGDALDCFYSSGLDALFLGQAMVQK